MDATQSPGETKTPLVGAAGGLGGGIQEGVSSPGVFIGVRGLGASVLVRVICSDAVGWPAAYSLEQAASLFIA